MPIRVLPEDVVARIAAGEAIERPASAVKELIENAIDAGASAIHVEAAAGGRQLLRVSDNGSGISREDAALAFKRHATSKLRAADELQRLNTLGFRGEALASIAAVSRATIVTRQRDEDSGLQMQLEGGLLQHQRQIGAPAGTVITIKNLFYNTPARLKFLKTDATEKRHIHWTLARYAIAYPAISFALLLDGRERFRSSGNGELADVLARAFGLADFQRMLAFESVDGGSLGKPRIAVKGYTSLPELNRSSRDRIMLFVNGRSIQDSRLSHAVTQAYEGLLKAGSFPFTAALITLPADFVDVNVHPTKAEVRFRDGQLVFVALQRAIREALQAADTISVADEPWQDSHFSDQYRQYRRPQPTWRLNGNDDIFDNEGLRYIPEAGSEAATPRTLPVLRVLGQVGASYIIAEGPAGLYLLDQNAAHERVLYQQLQAELAAGALPSFEPDEAETLLLSPADAELLCALEPLLRTLGFAIEPFGPNAFVNRALPAVAAGKLAGDILPQMLERLRHAPREPAAAIKALAAALAFKRGQVLQTEAMAALITRLERCPNPLAAPSGAKTLIHLTREQLAEEFRRA